VIREDRELLAELARLNTAMAPLAMRIMDGSATEQRDYACRLITPGEWSRRRADRTGGAVVEGEVLITGPIALSAHTAAPHPES
jgi:hypothetical protein